MATDNGPIATQAPPAVSSALQTPSAGPPIQLDPIALEPSQRTNPLKRPREGTPTSPISSPAQLTAKSARFRLRSASPVPLTGAATLEAERRRREEELHQNPPGISENPGHSVLTSLIQGTSDMSRAKDAPEAPTAVMDDAPREPIEPIPTIATEDHTETSPRSITSGVSLEGAPVTESPTPMDIDAGNNGAGASPQADRTTAGSLSYPGPLHNHTVGAIPVPSIRGMSYPMPSSSQELPASPTPRKHKCPVCYTEFTRHHNLKSHLLTHSQEKPYVCQECDLRFRRLHDLKRHNKLHTGEKNHICPKCNRKFARGDALARHSKGAGGCAGRRSSMGSFGNGDDVGGGSMTEGDDSSMTGIVFNEEMTEDERRRQSMPNAKAQHVAGQDNSEAYASHSQTYPPVGLRSGPGADTGAGGLFPPNADRGSAGTAASPSMPNSTVGGHTPNTSNSSVPMSTASVPMYGQNSMTESPKPLSPADVSATARQRSPSLTQQLQQQRFGRTPSLSAAQGGPKPPSTVSGFVAPDTRPAKKNSRGAGVSQNARDGNNANVFASGESGLWEYIHTLESRVSRAEKKMDEQQNHIHSLEAEVTVLNKQIAAVATAREATDA